MSKKLQRIAAVFMAVMVTVLFVPVSVYADYAKEAIATLVKSGVITGNNNQISPKNNISRAEAAAMIYRIKF